MFCLAIWEVHVFILPEPKLTHCQLSCRISNSADIDADVFAAFTPVIRTKAQRAVIGDNNGFWEALVLKRNNGQQSGALMRKGESP